MASSQDFLIYILDLLREAPDIHYKKMMGEYVLYSGSTVFGGIYDNRFLVKKTASTSVLGMKEAIPYPTGESMILIDIENPREIARIVEDLVADLNSPLS